MIDADAFTTFETAGWDATAAQYDHYWPVLTSRLNDPLLDAVGAGPNTRVLDVACGPGYLAARAVERGATAVGIDIAEPMIEIARQRFPRAEFRQGDAQALPFADRCFDTVVGNLALPHFGRPEQAAAEFRRVLTSGGRAGANSLEPPRARQTRRGPSRSRARGRHRSARDGTGRTELLPIRRGHRT